MSISVACPACQSKLKVKATHAGQTVRCPACQGAVKIPSLEEPVAPRTAGAAASPELTGTLGRFTIRGVLGQGAFGTVYRAYDPILDRDVALKTPRRGTTDNGRAEQLVSEAKSAARLRHPLA